MSITRTYVPGSWTMTTPQEQLNRLLHQSALDVQVGGGHYKDRTIQPIEYIHANKLNYSEGAIVKYITRWREKNGYEDLEKIKHYVDLLIEMETKYGSVHRTDKR